MGLKEKLAESTNAFIESFMKPNAEKGYNSYWAAYLGGSYDNFNAYLRALYTRTDIGSLRRYKISAGSTNLENDKKAVAAMKECYQNAGCPTTGEELTVFRGAGRYIFRKADKINILASLPDIDAVKQKIEAERGLQFVEAGFLSTSLSKSHSLEFVNGRLLFEIKVPQGTKCLFATEQLEKRKGIGKLRHEDEVIFAPGSIMEIAGVELVSRTYVLVYANLLS
ncbi:MAG: ADP-ribosyltransferase [Treponema sp.]|nr:ADP-ribosyltransferase [Treponema sp.]